jgi:uncharacterized membrane protein
VSGRPIAILTNGTPAFSAVKWVGTATGVLGALILALNIPLSGWGWILFLVSSVSWTFAGLVMKDMSLAVLQFAFVVVDLIGVWRWLIV